jgi:3-methyl-2-oxobutanoate hydroxymethyltransferase
MITIQKLLEKKKRREKIVMLTAYDYPLARLIERAELDMILVGDSGGMVKLGYETTIPVTMEEMLTMVKSVRRGAPNTFIIADLPFMSYNISIEQAIENAGRMLKEGGADAVKLEGGSRMAKTVRAITDAGIVVQGHIGLTPQNVTQLGGFRSQGRNYSSAKALLDDALALEDAGIFSLILEAVPVKLANYLSKTLSIPTIGTGAGVGCDGQNLITPDVLGYFDRFTPKFAKQYVNISEIILSAILTYKDEVLTSAFPTEEHTYPQKDESYLDNLLAEYQSHR